MTPAIAFTTFLVAVGGFALLAIFAAIFVSLFEREQEHSEFRRQIARAQCEDECYARRVEPRVRRLREREPAR